MKIEKWVDLGAEVSIEIGADDVRLALAEAFEQVNKDCIFDEEVPTIADVLYAINSIAAFLKALTPEQIARLNEKQQELTANFLREQAKRFEGETGKDSQ